MPSIRLDFALSPLLIVLLALLVAAGGVLYYRSTHPPVTGITRWLLTLLRAGALTAVVFLIGQPTVHLVSTSKRPPGLAVLVDDSRSMRIVDRTGDRASSLRALLQSDALRTLSGRADVRYYTFGARWNNDVKLPGDTLPLNEASTDISSAFRNIAAEKERWNVNAVLLLTDGAYNVGRNPLYDALQAGLPTFAVGIGDSSQQRDLVVSRVIANDLVYSGVPSPVSALVKSTGYGGEQVEVTLTEGGAVLGRTAVTLESGNREYEASLTYTPQGEGMHKYTVRVSALPGELTAANNSREFFSRILKSKLRLLIIAGGPGPDLTSIRQTLSEEKNFAVTSFTQKRSSGFYEGPIPPAMLDSADCLVLIGMPTRETTPQILETLKNLLLEEDKPLLYVSGPDVDNERLSALGPVLPFSVQSALQGEQLVFLQPSDKEAANPILSGDPPGDASAWTKLPPIFRTKSVFRAKPEATVLAFARIQNVTLPDPLLLTRSVARQKSLACLGYGVWRLRLLAQGSSLTSDLFARFLQSTIRWLTVPEERRPLRVSTSKEAFSEGEPVEFSGQLYDATGRPVDDAQVHVVAQGGSKVSETDLRSIGNGRYEGSLEGLTEGEYTFQARAQLQGTTLGEENGRFSVGGLNLEYLDTRMNVDELREIAYRTGGAFLPPARIAELDTLLSSRSSFVPQQTASSTNIELWSWHYLLAAIILLFTAEWTVRKLAGML